MSPKQNGLGSRYDDIWLIEGVRTPFADYNGVLAQVSPIDLGIKAAREAFAKSGLPPEDVGSVVAGSVAQASFDAYMLPRHVGLYSGVPIEVPATLVQRVCGTGIEAIMQVADAVKLGKIELGLCVGAESMTRNPIAAYTHRGGFPLGKVEFKDFLWEALLDPGARRDHGRHGREPRARISDHARGGRPLRLRELRARAPRAAIGLPRGRDRGPAQRELRSREATGRAASSCRAGSRNSRRDDHVKPSPVEALAEIRPAFGGVQTGGQQLRPSSTARRRRWSARATMRAPRASRRSGASSRAWRWAAARDHGHRPGAGDHARARAGRPRRSPTSTASRSTRRSARNASPSSARSASITPRST